MSLTRKLLESMGLEADKVSTIIEAHAETVEALKSQIETYKADAEKYAKAEKDLAAANKELEELKSTGGDWQSKYEKLNEDFTSYKAEQSAKAEQNAKEQAYRELLTSAGVSANRISSIMRVADLNAVEMEEGKVKNAEQLTESIKQEWSDFIAKPQMQGVQTTQPLKNSSQPRYTKEEISKMSKDEINKNWDAIKASLN